MSRIISVMLIVACLLVLSACQTAVVPQLEIPLQSIEDGEVNINVAIDAAGWLVLHPATEAGEPDTSEELSRSYLAGAGEWTNIKVTVRPEVGEERTIFARLYYDNPLDRQFDPSSDNSSDPPVTTMDGIVQASFTVPGMSPYITIEEGDTARKLDFSVGIDAPCWLVIHPEATEGEPDTDEVLTRAYFTGAGEYDLTITMPSTIEAGTTIYAMLYYDNPADEGFTYTPEGDEDLPVQVDGSDVVESFEIGD